MAEKMTLMRALSLEKTLQKRIVTFFNGKEGPMFLGFTQGQNQLVKNTPFTINEFEKEAKSLFDKYNDLVETHRKLKVAISKANNETEIVILGKTWTITEALFYKQTLGFNQLILNELKKELKIYMDANEKVETNYQKNIETVVQTFGFNLKEEDKETQKKQLTSQLEKDYKLTLVDPINVKEIIKGKEQIIEKFNEEIDFVLNQANATTEIEF
jgi:glutamine amidotransferase-like uncharacterized protein